MVKVEVCAAVPAMVTDVGERLQVAGSLAAVGLIEQVRATAPVNPPEGVTVMVEVLPVVAPGLTVIGPLFVRA
jgi:acyl dehydratase